MRKRESERERTRDSRRKNGIVRKRKRERK